uniref:precorrin-2 dehydrogenase/sirohydrochlorin ferrochelatase family protein n=1 Tax=Agathobacter sp. TaxID=2021311 RepID=UPI00405740E8
MALFPFFVDIEGKTGIIIGGGRHALEKIQRIYPFKPYLIVFSDDFILEIQQLAKESKQMEHEIVLVHRMFQDSDLEIEPYFVIVAGDLQEENRRISALCQARKILVNVVDDQLACEFVFPSLISRGNLSVGISTNGASPAIGMQLKKQTEALLPDKIEEILDWLQSKRPYIMEHVPDKKQRFQLFHKLAEICMEENRILTEEECALLIGDES